MLEERKKGYEEQLNHEREQAQLVRRRLQKENEELLDHHGKEAAIWKEMKQYDQATALYKQEIEDVKNTLHTTQNHFLFIQFPYPITKFRFPLNLTLLFIYFSPLSRHP